MPLYPGCRERCPKCPNANPVIPGEGPRDAKIVFIGEAPGKNENEQGRPFVGKAGKEFREHYLRLAGLIPSDVYITNACKCFIASSGKAPSESLVASCGDFHLKRELSLLSPDVVVPMGAVAGRALGASYHLDMQAGIPFRHTAFGVRRNIFPVYHPALGLHKTGSMLYLSESFRTLGVLLDGNYRRAQDPGKGHVEYAELTTEKQVRDVYRVGSVAIDTETVGGIHDPAWCLTFSQDERSGYLIRRNNTHAVKEFNIRQNTKSSRVYIHNCLFDLNVLHEMEVAISDQINRLVDTMHGAYHLAKFERIGLKPLSYRHLGIRMKDFDDVVTPYWEPLALDFIETVNQTVWGKPEKVWVQTKEKGRHLKQPQSLNTKIKRLISDYVKSEDQEKKIEVLERWWDWEKEMDPFMREMIAEVYGAVPKKSIIHVPFAEALEYACTDSRATWILGETFLPEQREKL